jgi:hypothetical protein
MSSAVAVAVTIGLFFIVGIAVGVMTVIALSAVRADRRPNPGRPDGVTDPEFTEHRAGSIGMPVHRGDPAAEECPGDQARPRRPDCSG